MDIQKINNTKWLALSAGMALATMGIVTAPAAQAATYTLNFETGADGGSILTNANGTIDTTQWSDWGLTDISGINDRTNNAAKFTLYNTDTWGRDNDLRTGTFWKNGQRIDTGTPNQGNVLIIQEEDGKSYRNGIYQADDEARGGHIDFNFANTVALNSFSMLDIDDNGGGIMVSGQKSDGSLLNIDIDALMSAHRSTNGTDAAAKGDSVSINGVTMTQVGNFQGDNSMFRFDISEAHLTNVRFSYPGSGAISGLEWSSVGDDSQEIPEPSALAGLFMVGLVAKRLRRRSAAE